MFTSFLMMFMIFLPEGTDLFAQEFVRNESSVIRITQDEAVKMALENNLSLEKAKLDNKSKSRAAFTAWNTLIPKVDLSAAETRLNDDALWGNPLASPYEWNLGAGLSASLSLNIATFVGMKATIDDYLAGKITVEKARLQLERDVRKGYFNLLLAKEQVALLQQSFRNAQARSNMANANYRAGLIPEVSMLSARVAMENMRPEVDNAENAYKVLMANYALYLGLPYDTQLDLAEVPGNADFIPLDTAEMISKAAANRPDIEELRRNLITLKTNRWATIFNLYTPTVSLLYASNYTFDKNGTSGGYFNRDNWSNDPASAFRLSITWRLNAFLPFTPEFNSMLTMNEAVRSLNISLAQAVQGTQIEVYNIILQLEKIRTTAEAQRLTVQLAERTLRLSDQAYRNGLKEFNDVQSDLLALRQAQLGAAQQNYNYLMGLLDLEYATGVPFGSISQTVPSPAE
jgi:outer membrane protein TolC